MSYGRFRVVLAPNDFRDRRVNTHVFIESFDGIFFSSFFSVKIPIFTNARRLQRKTNLVLYPIVSVSIARLSACILRPVG